MNQANKIKLGAFVTSAGLLILLCFFAFGLMKIFEPSIHAMTIFDSSVEGLLVGSPVKFMGVPIGQVSRIAIRDNDGYINVYFDIRQSFMDNISDNALSPYQTSSDFRHFIDKNKMSCFINAAGIMGGAFLELTSENTGQYALPDLRFTPPSDTIYIKSRTSHVTNVIQNVSKTVDQLTKVNFVELADKVNYTMDSVNRIFENKEIVETLKRFNNISRDFEYCSANLREALSRDRVAKLSATIDALHATIQRISQALPAERVAQLTAETSQVLKEMEDFLKTTAVSRDVITSDITSFRRRVEQTATRLEKTLLQFSQMLDSLENQPDQFIRGNRSTPFYPAPPVVKP